jgi:hypothetical protein
LSEFALDPDGNIPDVACRLVGPYVDQATQDSLDQEATSVAHLGRGGPERENDVCSCAIEEVPEVGGEHARDRIPSDAVGQMVRTLQIDGSADDRGISGESLLPEWVTEENHARRARRVVLLRKPSAEMNT